MRDATGALEAALSELEQARAELPEDLRGELDSIIDQARRLLDALARPTPWKGDATQSH